MEKDAKTRAGPAPPRPVLDVRVAVVEGVAVASKFSPLVLPPLSMDV